MKKRQIHTGMWPPREAIAKWTKPLMEKPQHAGCSTSLLYTRCELTLLYERCEWGYCIQLNKKAGLATLGRNSLCRGAVFRP